MYKCCLKRLQDLLISLILFIIFLPVMILIAIVLMVSNKGKVFFTQERPGLNEKTFKLIKFKTMNDKKDLTGNLLPDKNRITKFGLVLRKTSLDELPEIFNILLGQMSLIGPRPLLMKYLPFYTENEKKRHLVRPGLTGLAQVNGRNTLTWEDKLDLDVKYVENLSFILDLKILVKTLFIVFRTNQILDAAPQGSLDKYRKK